MKIPSDKKLVNLYCYVPNNEYISLLEFLKEKLPKGIELSDVVLTETYTPDYDGGQESRGTSSLDIGYLIPKSVHDKKVLKEKISDLEEEIRLKKNKLLKLRAKKI